MGIRIELNDGTYFLSDNPKEDLMNNLIKMTTEAGHLLTFDEASSDLGMIRPNLYAFYYGSFSEAAQIAWKKVATRLSQTAQSEKERADMSSNYSFETVKEQLIDYYNEHGRMPTQSEIMSNPNLPSWTTMIKFLGPKSGWAQLLPPSAEDHLESSSSDEEPSIEEHHESAPHDECVVPVLDDEVEIRQAEGAITIEVKLSLPHRDKPVTFTITV